MSNSKNLTVTISLVVLLLSLLTFTTLQPALAASDPVDGCEQADINENESNTKAAESVDTNSAEDQCAEAQSAKLAKQATVTVAEAKKIATDNNSGKGPVTEILLASDEADNGVARIVYEIELTSATGQKTDVKVDAITGTYLGVDIETDETTVTQKNDIQNLQTKLMTLLQQLIALLQAKV